MTPFEYIILELRRVQEIRDDIRSSVHRYNLLDCT